jgi:hypothetical protein
MSTPRIASSSIVELLQQDAVAVEQITNTNKKQPVDVYVVIKNQPFNVSLLCASYHIHTPINA